jgi:hypothetical protein
VYDVRFAVGENAYVCVLPLGMVTPVRLPTSS